jgi:hypothetical protein
MARQTKKEKAVDTFVGVRIELHPGCDLWMRGARFGTITGFGGSYATVRMDHPQVKKLQRIPIERLSARASCLIGTPEIPHVLTGERVYFLLSQEGRAQVSDEPGYTERKFWIDGNVLERIS